jgi:hypothetical protein
MLIRPGSSSEIPTAILRIAEQSDGHSSRRRHLHVERPEALAPLWRLGSCRCRPGSNLAPGGKVIITPLYTFL